MKNIIIILSIIIALSSCFAAYHYYARAQGDQRALHQERYTRMVVEEDLKTANVQIASLQADLKVLNEKNNNLEKLLEQGEHYIADLQGRLDKAALIKKEMEKKINELQEIPILGRPGSN